MNLGKIIIDFFVVCIFIAIAYYAPIPMPFKWVAWVIVFLIACLILLPLAGVSI
jgi:hypothetical protein